MASNRLRAQSGFSLLEILIVTAILGGIAVIASAAIKNGLNTKRRLDARLRVESMVFDALRLMSTDVERAFHYQHALFEIDRASMAGQNNGGQNTGGQNNGGNDIPDPNPADPTQQLIPPPRLTNLIGKEESVHFTTLNHYRTTANSQESNQIEVGYYLENCKSRATGRESKCLWRRSSTIIDNDVTRGGDATPLIENVSEFKIQYLSENINLKEWKNEWLTDNNGNADTQNMFPAMIKFKLTVEDQKEKATSKFSQTMIASVRSTNNVDPAKRFASGGNAGNNAGGGPGGANAAGGNGGNDGGTGGDDGGGDGDGGGNP